MQNIEASEIPKSTTTQILILIGAKLQFEFNNNNWVQ